MMIAATPALIATRHCYHRLQRCSEVRCSIEDHLSVADRLAEYSQFNTSAEASWVLSVLRTRVLIDL